MIDISAAVVLAKNAADAFKSIREAVGKKPEVVNAELTRLNGIVLEMQEQLRTAHIEITELEGALAEAKKLLEFKEALRFRSETGVYWRDDWPYCPNCWDADRKPIRLTEAANGIWICPIHKTSFSLNYTKEPKYWKNL